MTTPHPLKVTELVLRDAHQSLLATRLRIDDMLPIAEKLDQSGFWSLEMWGGATFDACIRFLGEDPWERLRLLRAAMPKTKTQMLFRGQNILGYRHYADDLVRKFVERAAANGMDVFRIFDAMNDVRNLKTAILATIEVGKHAQGTLSYTVSPVHTANTWTDMAKELEDLGCHSLCIKDMAGLLTPYTAFEMVKALKQTVSLPIHLHCHATTGLSTATILKAAEAGLDAADTAISSMSMTTGHSATESIAAIFEGTNRDTGLSQSHLGEISDYFRKVRKKYARFEGSLRGVDSRILRAQVPGGMLTNMENQLRQSKALDRMDEVLLEIPRVRKDLGFIPLVTPTSQIVGTQAVLNVIMGTYKNVTKETRGILAGEYGRTPAPVDEELRKKVLGDQQPITVRPADLLEPEVETLTGEIKKLAQEKGFRLAADVVDDALTYALFPQPGLKFLENRGDPDAFEPVPTEAPVATEAPAVAPLATKAPASSERYTVVVNGTSYDVEVSPEGAVASKPSSPAPSSNGVAKKKEGLPVSSPLAGNVVKTPVKVGDTVLEGQVVVILEAMKMETEVRAPRAGRVGHIEVREGEAVDSGRTLLTLEQSN